MSTTATTKSGYDTRKAAAARWNVSLSTIDRLIESGELTAYRLGRVVRIDLSQLDRLFQGGRDAA